MTRICQVKTLIMKQEKEGTLSVEPKVQRSNIVECLQRHDPFPP